MCVCVCVCVCVVITIFRKLLHFYFISIGEFILFYRRNCEWICFKEKKMLLLQRKSDFM